MPKRTKDDTNSNRARLYKDRAEVLHQLNIAQDHAIAWVLDLVCERQSEGLGAATQALERIGKRVDAADERMAADGGNGPQHYTVTFLDEPDTEQAP